MDTGGLELDSGFVLVDLLEEKGSYHGRARLGRSRDCNPSASAGALCLGVRTALCPPSPRPSFSCRCPQTCGGPWSCIPPASGTRQIPARASCNMSSPWSPRGRWAPPDDARNARPAGSSLHHTYGHSRAAGMAAPVQPLGLGRRLRTLAARGTGTLSESRPWAGGVAAEEVILGGCPGRRACCWGHRVLSRARGQACRRRRNACPLYMAECSGTRRTSGRAVCSTSNLTAH